MSCSACGTRPGRRSSLSPTILEEAIALADKVVVLTAGPGKVKAVFDVDLPRPRHIQQIRFEPEFVSIYQNIWDALRSEVDTAYARTTKAAAR